MALHGVGFVPRYVRALQGLSVFLATGTHTAPAFPFPPLSLSLRLVGLNPMVRTPHQATFKSHGACNDKPEVACTDVSSPQLRWAGRPQLPHASDAAYRVDHVRRKGGAFRDGSGQDGGGCGAEGPVPQPQVPRLGHGVAGGAVRGAQRKVEIADEAWGPPWG